MNFKNIPQLFLNVLGNQTLQSKTIQTQKHYNPAEPSLYRLQNPLIQNLLLLISVNFYYLFFQNSLSLSTSKSELHGQTFVLRNSPFTTFPYFSFSSQLATRRSPLFKIETPWPYFSFSSLHGHLFFLFSLFHISSSLSVNTHQL